MRAESLLDGMLDSLCLRALTWHAQVRAHAARKADERHRSLEIYELAEEAYLYGYPLVLMDHSARFSAIAPRSISSVLPNVHTLSTSAFIDLSHGPWLFTLPDTSDRYYFVSMLDAYSNVFASLGTRATGTSAAEYAIVGPRWKRALPPGCKVIGSPSDLVWLRGQFQVDGNHDLPAVFALTAHCTLRRLNEREKPATHLRVDPTFNMRAPAGKLVAKLSDHAFFERLSGLLARYPPPARDAEILKGFERLGLRPGYFSPPASAVRAITGAARRARRRMHVRVGAATHGWSFDPPLGAYDTLYFERAAAALWAFGANLPEDAVSLSTSHDAHGRPLEGKSDYVLHLDPAHEPPAAAFWSLSLYDRYGHVVSNRIDRYALASSDALTRNHDGSLDIYIQREPPASASLANWLPAPDAPYQLILRLYSPEPRALHGDWVPPSIHARALKLRAQELVRNAPNAPAS
jgi:hypothetical protein